MVLDEVTRESVLRAIEEFKRIGRDSFLAKYGYRKSYLYQIEFEGDEFDSKAILGAAHRIQFPGEPIPNFGGGDPTRSVLEGRLKFRWVPLGPRRILGRRAGAESLRPASAIPPLVLTQNEAIVGDRFSWEDIEGVQYHYPNQYRNLVTPGAPFVYYRGVHRSDGSRGQAEYFGTGLIDEVWTDPSQPEDTPPAKRHWYCSIADYVAFQEPVPAKTEDGFVEGLGRDAPLHGNHFRPGVRALTEEAYAFIVEFAGLSADAPVLRSGAANLEPVDTLEVGEAPLDEVVRITRRSASTVDGTRWRGTQRSREPKVIGDRAEEIVYRVLCERHGVGSVRWMARDGETPGWDIEYADRMRGTVRAEVKGTTASRFTSLNLTRNEWDAAQSHGPCYELWLVSSVLSSSPRYAVLLDVPAAMSQGRVSIEPSVWELRFERGR
ncbi:MAG: hypothetical protein CVU47_04960 [Chloroflexi bacterium HGW-Chloroflexi-9]|nr:MAG: hypothetical protein CVU47_04960 [Chloroflexi bacterium HGW-Chloroflexi-9]